MTPLNLLVVHGGAGREKMSVRFVVVNARPMEHGQDSGSANPASRVTRGYLILDRHQDQRLPDCYMSRSEAQEECDRRNEA